MKMDDSNDKIDLSKNSKSEKEETKVNEKLDNSFDDKKYELIEDSYYYTDESTNCRYKYDNSKSKWVEIDSVESSKSDPSQVETDDDGRQYYWADGMYLCRNTEGHVFYMDEKKEWKAWYDTKENTSEAENKWYFCKKGESFYRNKSSNKVFRLNKESNEWEEYKRMHRKKRNINSQEEFDSDDNEETSSSEDENSDSSIPPGANTDPSIVLDGKIYTKHDPMDNMKYEWEPTKKAWFPKIDEDFMATYQLSYGFNPDGTKNENPLKFDDDEELEKDKEQEIIEDKKKTEEKVEKPKPGWFEVEDAHNLKVYVSSLPRDMDEDGFVEFMSKCGLVCKDPISKKFKVKMYKDKEGKFKGDALCTYIKIESVELALNILDGYRLDGSTVGVERAKFTQKGDYNPALKPKKKKKKALEKEQRNKEKLFDWRPDPMRGQRMKHEDIVIFKNVFDPSEFEGASEKVLVHQAAIRAQAESFGSVKRAELFDRHAAGVVKVTFEDADIADMCVATLHGRLYGKRRLHVTTWDGVAKYNVEETPEELDSRLQEWSDFLEGKK